VAFAAMKKFLKLLLLACFLLKCSTPPSQISNTGLRFGIPEAPTSLDPATTTDLIYYQIVFNILETLVVVDWKTGTFMPALATSWQADSAGLCWTFRLRQGVLFMTAVLYG
jgi:ABC-type transport system substrate-binding protein